MSQQALAFWDLGSNVNLVTRQFAESAGWKGRTVTQRLQTTGNAAEEWHTTAYWVPLVDRDGEEHVILAFQIDSITAPLGYVNVEAALNILPNISLVF